MSFLSSKKHLVNDARRFSYFVLLLAGSLFGALACQAQREVVKINDSVVDASALTVDGRFGQSINGVAYQQNALMTFKGYQYVSWYNGQRKVCIARRKLPDGEWQTLTFDDYTFQGDDAHNVISLGISPGDGKIHLAFDHHGDPLNYRVSEAGVATHPGQTEWSADLFSPVRDYLRKGHKFKLTYPRFIITPDDRLQLFYRDKQGTRLLHTYDSKRGNWSGPRPIVADNGYTNYNLRYDTNGDLPIMWHWRNTGHLSYMTSSDQGRSWQNNAGTPILSTGEKKPVAKSALSQVSVIETAHAPLIMLGGQASDSQGRTHELVWHVPDDVEPVPDWGNWRREYARYHHYWRDKSGQWHTNLLPGPAGWRGKIFFDEQDNAYALYTINKTDEWAYNIYLSHGELIIASATPEKNWTDWQIIHREPGPFLSEPLFDYHRWKKEGVLSVFSQESPDKPSESTPLHVIDYRIRR